MGDLVTLATVSTASGEPATVSAWLQPTTASGPANSGVIVDSDGITIVDAQTTIAAAAELAGSLAPVDLPIRRLAVTSSHLPYVGGSSVFTLAAVYGSAATSFHLDQPVNLDSCRALYDIDPGETEAIAEAGTRAVTHTVAEAAWISGSAIVVPTGGELVENLIVQVPDAQVVFLGAMGNFGVRPLAGFGDPAAWAAALDQASGYGEIFVPGRGPIGGREELAAQAEYLRACVAAEGDPSGLADGPWRDWPGHAHDRVNIDRAAALASGRHEPPASLLALCGL